MRYAAFLRAINVGSRKVAMAELRAHVEALGYAEVATILQSGTVVFSAAKQSNGTLEAHLEAGLAKRLGLDAPLVVRTAAQVAAILEGNPFDREAESDPSHLVAVVLKTRPSAAKIQALEQAIAGRERIAVAGDVMYVYYPDGIGESKLTAAKIDKVLGTIGTARNWNTMRKIAAALG